MEPTKFTTTLGGTSNSLARAAIFSPDTISNPLISQDLIQITWTLSEPKPLTRWQRIKEKIRYWLSFRIRLRTYHKVYDYWYD